MNVLNNGYFYILFFSLVVNIFPPYYKRKYNSFLFVLLTIATILLISIRPLKFSDDENYLSMLEQFRSISFNELGKISGLFYLINSFLLLFITNYSVLLKVNFILIWVFILISFFYEKVKYKLEFFTFFILLFQVLFFIQLRNAFAIVFLNWGLIRSFNKKSTVLFFIISALFHFSVIPFLLFYYFRNNNINSRLQFFLRRRYFIILLTIIISLSFFNIFSNYIVTIPFYEKYLLEYISMPETGKTSVMQLILLFFHLLIMLPLKNIVLNDSIIINKCLLILIDGLILGVIFYSLPLFQRFSLPFFLYSIISFIYIFKLQTFPIKNNLYYKLLLVIYLAIAINRINYFDNWHLL